VVVSIVVVAMIYDTHTGLPLLRAGADGATNRGMEDRILARYQSLGGLAEVCRRYEANELTLGEISRAIGFSRQTASNDLLRFLGRRPEKTPPPKPTVLRAKTAAEFAEAVVSADPRLANTSNHRISNVGIPARSTS
jgi:hypothetical protein